jgi:hypothetical protein
MKIDDLPSTFLLTDKQINQLNSLPYKIVEDHVQVLKHDGHFYHLNPDLVFDVDEIVLCPVCAIDPMMKSQESIAAGDDYGRLAHLKPLNGITRNACVPVRLYNINLQIRENHSTNHSIAIPMDGPVECLIVLPCVDINHRPHVTVRLTSIDHPPMGGKFTATPGGLTNLFYGVARTSSMIELVLLIIKYGLAPLEDGPKFAPN